MDEERRLVAVPTLLQKSDALAQPPRVALLGWCDRAVEVNEGHPAFWHQNILGLSRTKVFHVYPINIRGHKLAIAIYQPNRDEELRLVFRKLDGDFLFELVLNVIVEEIGGASAPQEAQVRPHSPGWVTTVAPVDVDVVLLEPAPLSVHLCTTAGETYLGMLVFFHAPVPPLTTEDISAIRSDPLALKLVRLQYSCKSCTGALKTYAGIERNPKLESEGWSWYEGLGERFTCTCGNTAIELKYLRTGLHGMLRRRLSPVGTSTYESVRLYERTALEQFARDFETLLNTSTREEEMQVFLASHPIFFCRFAAHKIIPKPPVLAQFVADFAILNKQKELLLIEIEKADLPILRTDGGTRAELTHAVDQVRGWLQVFDEHRAAALSCLGLELTDVVVIRGVVIAGRTPKDEELARRARMVTWKDVDFYTYDDLKGDVAEIVRHIASA